MFMLLIKFMVLFFVVIVVSMLIRYEFLCLLNMIECMFGEFMIMLMMVKLMLGYFVVMVFSGVVYEKLVIMIGL